MKNVKQSKNSRQVLCFQSSGEVVWFIIYIFFSFFFFIRVLVCMILFRKFYQETFWEKYLPQFFSSDPSEQSASSSHSHFTLMHLPSSHLNSSTLQCFLSANGKKQSESKSESNDLFIERNYQQFSIATCTASPMNK